MSIRISQRQMYSSFIGNMNNSLAALMESNLQGATEKQINRPSDDPAGAARVLMFRQSLDNITQYKKNVQTADGWLSEADSTLIQVQEVLALIKEKVEEASNGTMTAENREQISYDLREQLAKLLGLANTEFDGQHIFAGHKTGQAAYVEVLGATCNDPNFKDAQYIVSGGASYTTLFQFTSDGNTDTAGLTYRYSQDGGTTWQTGTSTLDAYGNTIVSGGGVQVTLPAGRTVTAVDTDNANEGYNYGAGPDNGTWLYVRPTAQYVGDDNGVQVNRVSPVQPYGSTATATGTGYFTRDVAVRIDDATGPPMKYSYSLDDGSNWTQVTAPPGTTKLPIPGGFLNVTGTLADGDQFNVHPRRADINFEVSPGETITVNLVGKDVFGGLFQDPMGIASLQDPTTFDPFFASAQPVDSKNGGNVFEVVGRAIMYAETNSQHGMQKALDELTACMNVVLTQVAKVGGREDRLGVVYSTLTMRELDESDALSKIEDVDVTALMTKLAQQQLAYNTVLKSSSMIMQMSLMNFI